MSLDATIWAWQQRDLRPSEKLVLLSLADRANHEHKAWPGIETLVLDTCLNKETIISAINSLVKSGHLIKKRRFGKSTIYELIGVVDRHSIPENRNSGKVDDSFPEKPPIVFRKAGKESLKELRKEPIINNIFDRLTDKSWAVGIVDDLEPPN